MTGGSLPRAFRDVCQQTTLAASGRSIVTLYLRHILRPLCRQFPQIGEWNTAKIAVEESETHDRHLLQSVAPLAIFLTDHSKPDLKS